VAQLTVDKCGRITKISNVAISGGGGGSSQWTGTKGDPIYYVPYVGIGSSSTPTANLQVTGNVYVSNALTTPNVHVTDTLDVLGSMTANAANATFFFDTFTIPYINTQYLNVASNIVLTGNLSAPLANITTLNVQYLYANSAIIYGTSTLNVYGVSNLSTTTINGNLYVSNALTTTNVFVSGNVYVGSPIRNLIGNVQLENVNMFIGNSYWTSANSTNGVVGPPTRLIFDNTTTPYAANKILLHSNTASANICGFGVVGVYNTVPMTLAYYTSGDHSFSVGANQNFGGTTAFAIRSAGYIDMNGNGRAKLDIGTYGTPSSNTTVRIDGSNVALVTSGSGLVGFGTIVPTANLHVIGNLYVSNAMTTTNVFAATETLTGTTGQTTLNVTGNLYVSNAVTTTNVFAATETLTGTTGQTTLNITGNLYASNAVTTTNITCAGFTSNISNTIFNYDTLTIPFISCTTLNVASTANVLTLSIPGSIGQTTLNVTGNVYASNALTTTNVFAATETLTGSTGRTTSTITGNLYVSNALTTTNVFANTVSTVNPIPFRNRIINGAMNIWQRTVASTSTAASAYTTADRWCGALGTTNLTLTQFAGPTESPQFANALQIATTTLASGTPLIEQRIENVNISDFLNGTPVSVSFWAGQTVGTLMPLTVGLYYATAVNNFGTQTLAVAATQNTPTLTTANVYYSLSFTLTTSLGATNGISLRFTTGGATSAGSTFLLSGVQVEKGAFATPFEVRPYSTELALAQRYYYQLTSPTAAVQGSASVYAIFGTATGITTTAFWVPIQFPVTMRTPNYTFSNSAVSSFQLLPTGTTTITSVGLQTDSFTPVSATLNFAGTNITAGGSYIFRTNGLTGSTTAFFGFSCEL
jgi:hypothetical protein